MRGTALWTVTLDGYLRITPAHAGNRIAVETVRPAFQDHPRACGEQMLRILPCLRRLGSPPRMRGTVCPMSSRRNTARITPAHAGNSAVQLYPLEACADHPRACGEQFSLLPVLLPVLGSPPRMRGTDRRNWRSYRLGRITPAHAGNRTWKRRNALSRQDHPRACGEQLWLCKNQDCLPGSPPRMRGTD